MEFNKAMVYTAVNADELKSGDKVIGANCMADLKDWVQSNENAREIRFIHDDTNLARFEAKGSSGSFTYALAYLIERKENCTNCDCCVCAERNWVTGLGDERIYCCPRYKPKTEEKAEPHYRPFKDIAELIKTWTEKGGKWQKRELTMPNIWVMYKERGNKELITVFKGDNIISTEFQQVNMQGLFKDFLFLDGSPCGVEVVEE